MAFVALSRTDQSGSVKMTIVKLDEFRCPFIFICPRKTRKDAKENNIALERVRASCENVSVSYFIQRILWVDCIGAILTGLIMLLLSGGLSFLYGLPVTFVVGHAFVHLVYGTYSFSLAVRKRRPMALLLVLIFANAAWAVFCIIFAVTLISNASIFAVLHFIFEGIYVGGLAAIEWNRRESLLTDG